ncbi:MAG: hypothetical protein RBS02_17065 [Steroidobacteraceae bacterium]|jgi:DNA-binding NtrC family response regulator|nr:hypothetical protein [Steroidobacteraceae bacterium]
MLGASASAYALLRGKRVFMVEDDDRLYCALKDTLNDAGCETFGLFTAASENLYAVPSSQFDVALVDVSRRDARFARVIQSLNERGVPMLLITGRSRTDLPAQLQRRPWLAKPFTEQDLLDGIANVIEQGRSG